MAEMISPSDLCLDYPQRGGSSFFKGYSIFQLTHPANSDTPESDQLFLLGLSALLFRTFASPFHLARHGLSIQTIWQTPISR